MTRTEVGTAIFLAILASLQVADAVTTRMVLDAGGSEGNPLMTWAAESMSRLLVVKAVWMALVARVAWACRMSGWPVVWLALACIFCTGVAVWNMSNLVVAAGT